MECVQNILLSKRQNQKEHFDKAHSTRELAELKPGQEVLFLSPAADEYIPSTIVKKATNPHSYIVEAQGKCYHRTREHTRPIPLNIHQPAVKTPKPSHIPKPHPQTKTLFQPQKPKHPIPPTPKIPSLHPKPHSKAYTSLQAYTPSWHFPLSQATATPLLSLNNLPLGPLGHVFPCHSGLTQKHGQCLLPHAQHWRR